MDISQFRDQVHINSIRSALWCGREYGRASVMIGSGFSRYADPVSPISKPFPLWAELAGAMVETLSSGVSSSPRQSYSPLRIASEVEAMLGRSALNSLLLDNIQDNSFKPGRLHELLLNLPWSDVFTTNYDTLLERARAAVHERKYDVIQAIDDIPHRMKPRIVKLHGSFPSQHPFIITEEDYRTYPSKFAPYVNMVQQAIMENTVCLIGFSGDDPNFLYWSGWVRDNLGKAAPQIYLCGILNLSEAQRKVLEHRRVIPIDLSPLFSESDWPDPNLQHSKATEWLLLNLLSGEPPDQKRWPEVGSRPLQKTYKDMPDIPGSSSVDVKSNPRFSPSHPLKGEELIELRKTWTSTRNKYPGWVVTPYSNRIELWEYTEFWLYGIFAEAEKLEPPENLLLLYELIWRLDRVLCPLFVSQAETIATIVEDYNPFPAMLTTSAAKIRPDNPLYKSIDWSALQEAWINLVFALLREARDDQEQHRFKKWEEYLVGPASLRVDWQARLNYERCLFSLFGLDEEGLRQNLEKWSTSGLPPFWLVRRASLLAEIGELPEAEHQAAEALSAIRSRMQAYSPDYALLSQEGWTMKLLRAIRMLPGEELPAYQKRWDKLEAYSCNPWRDVERMKLDLLRPRPGADSGSEVVTEFDPGRVTLTFHTGGNLLGKLLPAFAFLRAYEEGALPMRCGFVEMNASEIAMASTWIEPYAPLWALCSIIRSANGKAINANFSRVRVGGMTQESVNKYYILASRALQQAVNSVEAEQGPAPRRFGYRLMPILLELLSRLSFRLAAEDLLQLYEYAIQMYKHPLFRRDHSLHEPLRNFIRRVFFALPYGKLFGRIPELLALPIPGVAGFEVSGPMRDYWPDPFEYIEEPDNLPNIPADGRSSWAVPIRALIDIVRHGEADARSRACARLSMLHRINALASSEKTEFANALWSKINPKTGLPVNGRVYQFAFLRLPEPSPGSAKKILRDYLMASDFPRTLKWVQNNEGIREKIAEIHGGHNWFIMELKGASVHFLQPDAARANQIEWSKDEAACLLRKAIGWWDEEKEELDDTQSAEMFGRRSEVRSQFQGLAKLLAEYILPALADAEVATKRLALNIIAEMKGKGIATSQALPFCLLLGDVAGKGVNADSVAGMMRESITSMNKEDVRGAIRGLFSWCVLGGQGRLPVPPADLIDELVRRILARRQPGLDAALQYAGCLIKRVPTLFKENHVGHLILALEYLAGETELTIVQSSPHDAELQRVISPEECPQYRALAGGMAYEIGCMLKSRGMELPQQILHWKTICEHDVLPEVRNAWPNEVADL